MIALSDSEPNVEEALAECTRYCTHYMRGNQADPMPLPRLLKNHRTLLDHLSQGALPTQNAQDEIVRRVVIKSEVLAFQAIQIATPEHLDSLGLSPTHLFCL